MFIQVKIKATRKSISSSVPKNTGIGALVIKEALVYSGLLENFEQKKAITNETIKSIVFMPLSTREWSGSLYLGSSDPERYNATYEPDLLNLLASVLKLSISMQVRGSQRL